MGDVPIPLLPRKEDVKVESLDMPPGFRFHPTDLEIILNYLLEKAIDSSFTSIAIADVDINGCEPWDLPGRAKMGEKDWWFFWHRGRKYPTGTRTNRATEKGYWKATGKDKEIFKGKGCLVGMKKTLVFYLGRAPKGGKTNWVMHEYRLEGKSPHNNNISSSRSSNSKNDWVVCRVFHKNEPKKEMELGDDGNWRISLKTSSFEADHSNSNYSDSSALPPLSDFPLYTLNSVPSSDPSHENNLFIQTTNPTYPPITPLFSDIPTTNPDSETYPGSLHFHPAAQHLSYLHLPDAQMFQMTLDPFKSTCKMENQQQPPSCSRDTGPTVDNGSSWDDAGSPSVGPLVDLEDFMWK